MGSTKEKVDLVKNAIDRGYAIDLLFVTLSAPELNIERIGKRVLKGGHDVDQEKVVARYGRTMSNLHKFIELADRADVYDNSGDRPQRVLVKENNICRFIADSSAHDWIKKYL